MPIAAPMMPASASGVSMTRSGPNSSNRPFVARKTPPNLPTSSPSTTTRLSRRISRRSASLTAWMMLYVGILLMSSVPGLRARSIQALRLLLGDVPRVVGVDLFEHRLERRGPERLRMLERLGELLGDLARVLVVDGLRPDAALDQVPAPALE